jgi:phage terminase large subunit-like protein
VSRTAEQYIDDILSGKILAGPYIIKAFQRHRRDLETAKGRGLYFDPEAGDFVIDFCETFCTPSDRDTPMQLIPWQQAILYITYGWKRADGMRRFRRLYLEIAKKNGKTGLGAALALYHLIADGESSSRVFIAATTGKQAKECFKEAAAMRMRNAELRRAIQQSGKGDHIFALFTNDLGRLSMMARDAASEDGALVSTAILDELHRWKNSGGLYSVLRYGGRTRRQPLMIELTTAGASAGGTTPCWVEREYGTKVLDGFFEDDQFAPWIFCMDPKDNWKDPTNWVKSNPSLGYLFTEERLVQEFNEVQGKPTDIGEFKRFGLNIWSSESDNPAIEIEKWDACCREDIANHPDGQRLFAESVVELKGRTCFAGLDLAPKLDTSALVLLFPPLKIGEKWRVLSYFWCPEDNVAQRVKRDRVPYDVWSEKKFITLTPGNLTDVRYVADQITEIAKQFDLKELAYDDAWSSELIRMLGESGFPMQKFVPFPQNNLRMNGPCVEFMRKVIRQEFAHDNNPVMRWQMANLRWNTNKITGMIRPSRDSKREKIDGCASLIMALARAIDPDNVTKPKREFFVVTSK